jgi:hypothetical protein
VHAVASGVVSSERFKEAFGRAVGALHARLLSGEAGSRVIELQDAVDRAVDAIAVVNPELAQRIDGASGEVQVGKGTAGRRLAQAVAIALLVAYGIAELLRLAGVGAGAREPGHERIAPSG